MTTKESYKEAADPALIAACLNGEGPAWEVLLHRYQRLIYSIPIRYGFAQHDADDIYQNVCLLLLDNLSQVRDLNKLGCWLITTTRRECSRYRRSDMPERSVGEFDENHDPIHQIPDPDLLPDDMCILWQQQHLLRHAIERLPERQRRLVHYLFYEPLHYEEIAERLDMPVASIGPTRARALQRLKHIMEAMDSEPVMRKELSVMASLEWSLSVTAAQNGHPETGKFL